MLTQKQAKKLWFEPTVNVKLMIDKEYVNNNENKTIKDKIINWLISFVFVAWIVNLFIVWMLFFSTANASEEINTILDTKIERFCNEHDKSDEVYFEHNMWYRCTLILQATYRFETWNLKSYVWNNIFNFRSPAIKKIWTENYWVKNIRWWFLVFPDKTNWIKFAVDRYYKFDRYKTIKQIIGWWYYCSPITKWCGNIQWFTYTEWDKYNYISYVKKYFKDNLITN